MITKKYLNEIYGWDPNAFGGKGYWYVLGKKGGLGRAASKKEAQHLGMPSKNETEPVSEKVYNEDEAQAKEPKKMNYFEAAKIRKKGFGESIADKILGGESIGKSIKGTISDKFKAKAMGVKEKFDPLNIARMLTGSGGAAILGKLTGRSREDIEYQAFKGKKRSRKTAEPLTTTISANKITPVQKGDPVADVAAKLFGLFKTSYDEQKKQRELNRNFDEERNNEAERRHKELLDAIDGKDSRKKTATPVKDKKENKGIIGTVLDMFGIGEGALGILSKVGPVLGLLTGPVALAILGAATLAIAAYTIISAGSEQENADSAKGMVDAGDISADSKSIMEAARDYEDLTEAEKKVEQTRQEQLKSALKDAPFLTKWYNKNTGKYLKQKGYSDKQIYEMTTPVQERKQTTIPAPQPEESNDAPKSSPVPSEDTSASTTSTTSTASPTNTATPVPTQSSAQSPATSTVSPAPVTATAMPAAPTTADKVETVTQENMKVQDQAQEVSSKPIVMSTTNNTAAPGTVEESATGSSPVRNDDSSVMRTVRTTLRMV